MQLTPVRIDAVSKKAYRITILVGEDEKPWKEGWFPEKLVRGVRYQEGEYDLLEVPDWMVKANGWQLPSEDALIASRKLGTHNGYEVARQLTEELGVPVGYIPPE